jgi:ABC-type transport system involved in multi-copper enzyme maturation permease subunit
MQLEDPAPRRHLRTVRRIAANAVRRHAGSASAWFLLVLAVLIGAASTMSGVSQVRHRSLVYAELAAQREGALSRAQQLNGWQVEPALRVLRPPEALSAVVAGAEAAAPVFWDFGPAGVRRGHPPGSLAIAQTPTDFDFVVRVVLGLLAIIMAIEAVAVERASGTLLAVLGQAVHPVAVLLGKFAGAGLALAVATLLVVGATTLTLMWTGSDLLAAGDVGRTLMLALPAWLYAMSCFALTVLVTTMIRSYYIAVTTVLILWVASGVTGMAVADLAARTFSPAPPTYLTESTAERVTQELSREAQLQLGNELALVLTPTAGDWRRAEAALADGDPAAQHLRRRWAAFAALLRDRLNGIEAEAGAAARRQRTIAEWFSFMSPGALFTTASSAMAGTGVGSATRWEQAAQAFQGELNRALFDDRPRLILHVPESAAALDGTTGRSIVAFNVRPAVAVAALPAFQPPDAGMAAWADGVAVPSLLLAGYVLGLASLAALPFARAVP